jgi:hypothetical protein
VPEPLVPEPLVPVLEPLVPLPEPLVPVLEPLCLDFFEPLLPVWLPPLLPLWGSAELPAELPLDPLPLPLWAKACGATGAATRVAASRYFVIVYRIVLLRHLRWSIVPAETLGPVAGSSAIRRLYVIPSKGAGRSGCVRPPDSAPPKRHRAHLAISSGTRPAVATSASRRNLPTTKRTTQCRNKTGGKTCHSKISEPAPT